MINDMSSTLYSQDTRSLTAISLDQSSAEMYILYLILFHTPRCPCDGWRPPAAPAPS